MATFVDTTSTTAASSTSRQNAKHVRIILLGGPGKECTWKFNLGRQFFQTGRQFDPVTVECSTGSCRRYLDDEMNQELKIFVTDTPGVCSTREDNDEVTQLIEQQIFKETSPGPHAILIVCRIDRFTRHDEEIIELIQSTFGPNAIKYCIFIFTHEDQLEPGDTVQTCIKRSNRVNSLMQKYNNRYLSIINKNVTEEKIKELIEMINKMVTENGNEYYTNTEYQYIERQRQIEKKQKALEEEAKQSETERMRRDYKNLEEELANERSRPKNAQHENTSKQHSPAIDDLYAGLKKVLSSALDIGVRAANAYVDHDLKKKEQSLSSAPVPSTSESQLVPPPDVKNQLKASSAVPTVSDSTSKQIEVISVQKTTSSVTTNSVLQDFDDKTQRTLQSPFSPPNSFDHIIHPKLYGHPELLSPPEFKTQRTLQSPFSPPDPFDHIIHPKSYGHSALFPPPGFRSQIDPSKMLDPSTRRLMENLKLSSQN